MKTIDVFLNCVQHHGPRPAMHVKHNGTWQTITWTQYHDRVQRAAKGMIALGLQPGDGVVILGNNRPEWVIADVAAVMCSAMPAGIYTTSSAEQCAYIANHCDAVMAIVDTAEQRDKLLAVRSQLPRLQHVIVMDHDAVCEGVITFDSLCVAGEGVDQALLDARIQQHKSDDACALIYTSGTTGRPKAVMITHEGVACVAEALLALFALQPTDRLISYLPMSHIAEQAITIYAPMTSGASVYFAESIDRLGDNLQEVRPTLFLGVPRVWEKIQSKMQSAGAQVTGFKKQLAIWAKAQGLAAVPALERGQDPGWKYHVANRLIFSQVRKQLGLDACRLQATAAAPIARATLEYFASVGVPLYEVYGMSECTGPGTVSLPHDFRLGACGRVVPGTELRIADDGEILMRGKHVFKGYLKDPEATREAIDAEGWLHSGDLGALDAEGFLQITGRKKDLIITAGGENISPSMIEHKLQSILGVSHTMVVGDRQKYLTALLTLDHEKLAMLARVAGSPATTVRSASECPLIQRYVDAEVQRVNTQLARVQTIKAFRILPCEFTQDTGELTATMKLKRNVVLERYADVVASMYDA